MHSYSRLWDTYISDENIYASIQKSSIGKRDRPSVAAIYYDQEAHLEPIREYATHFYNMEHHPIIIPDGTQHKQRVIVVPDYREQIIHHMVIRTMMPMLTRGMYEHSYGSVPGRGVHAGAKTIERWIRDDPHGVKYCLQMDVHHFFDSIDHDILKAMLERQIKDRRFLEVVETIIDATGHGLPLGFYTSQWLANWYMQKLDHYIVEDLQAPHYERYMDDMIVFGPNKKKLHQIREKISAYLAAVLNLEMKQNWQVFRFSAVDRKTGEDIYRPLNYMGFIFYRNRTVIRKSIALKAERAARRCNTDQISADDARKMLSYFGWLDSTDSYDWYTKYIKPYVDYQELRRIVSIDDKQRIENGGQ